MAAALTTGLLVLLVASQAMMRHEARAGRVPPIPAGHRAQYSLQHDDGSFKYGWDTGSGATAKVEGDAANEVRGSYSVGPYRVDYTAGVDGFVPVVKGLEPGQRGGSAPAPASVYHPPAVPPPYLFPATLDPAHHHGLGVKSPWASGVKSVSTHPAMSVSPALPHTGWQRPWASGVKSVPLRPAVAVSPALPETGWQSPTWTSGVKSVPLRPAMAVSPALPETGWQSPTWTSGVKSVLITPEVSPAVSTSWHATPSVPTAAPVPVSHWVQPEPEPEPEPEPDATYHFGYQTPDSSRQEASDPTGNVHGSYSFTGPDGVHHQVEYEAGAGKGFVVKESSSPAAPGSGSVQTPWQSGGGGVQSSWQSGGGVQSSWQSGGGVQQGLDVQQSLDDGGSQQTLAGDDVQQSVRDEGEAADVQSSQGGDGSYAFSYSTADQHRDEQGDAQGNVKGSFSFVAPDGLNRSVEYEAGAGKGFVAKGDHLPTPQPSEVAGVLAGAPDSGRAVAPTASPQDNLEEIPTEVPTDVPTALELEAATQGSLPLEHEDIDIRVDDKIDLRKLGADGDDSQQTIVGGDEQGSGHTAGHGGGSYAFSYSTADQHRDEQGDAQGNVQGSFSFVAPDGVNRSVEYEAGAGKGFVAKGDHLPTENVIVPPGSGPAPVGTPRLGLDSAADEQQTQGPFDDSQQTDRPPGLDDGQQANHDASYAYSYETDSSRKHETADAQGNVQGSFSFLDGAGQTKTVTYTARAGEGFKASGDHLPKPGQFLVPAAAAGVADVHGGARGVGRRPAATKGALPQALCPPAQPHAGVVPVDGASVRTYLPPGVPCHKVGYVYEDAGR